MSDLELLQRKLEREKQARKQAEALLEAKSLELFHANQQLRKAYDEMELRVVERTRELTVANECLTQEITERTRAEAELHKAKEAAETANRTKSEFLANMSHELRTPLHGILSFAGFGIKKAATANPEKLRTYFRQIDQSGRVLLVLLNDLLDLARLEAGRTIFAFQRIDLSVLLAKVADEFRSLVSEQDLTFQHRIPADPMVVSLDPVRIMQVIRNLLSNAVKFSPPGGTIELHICCGELSVVVAIRDHGVGIPEEELDTIFDKFVQSSKTKTGAGGTGLGLAICREIITAHQGRLWAENMPEGGAVFSFELPLAQHDEMAMIPGVVALGGDVEKPTDRWQETTHAGHGMIACAIREEQEYAAAKQNPDCR